jgi:hypothetical protein
MAESRKVELYAEQDKITQALRHWRCGISVSRLLPIILRA